MTITNIVKNNEGHAECIHKVRENNYNITKKGGVIGYAVAVHSNISHSAKTEFRFS